MRALIISRDKCLVEKKLLTPYFYPHFSHSHGPSLPDTPGDFAFINNRRRKVVKMALWHSRKKSARRRKLYGFPFAPFTEHAISHYCSFFLILARCIIYHSVAYIYQRCARVTFNDGFANVRGFFPWRLIEKNRFSEKTYMDIYCLKYKLKDDISNDSLFINRSYEWFVAK